MPKDIGKDLLEGAVATLAAAGEGSTTIAQAALEAVAPGIGPRLVGFAVEAKRKRDAKKFDDWMSEVAARLRYQGPADAESFIREHVDEPWAHGAVIDAVRAILGDLDEAVVPILARVTALQMEERRVDRRTKRLVAMLGEMDFEMLSAVREVLSVCEASFGELDGEALEVVVEPSPGNFRPMRLVGAGRAFLHGEEWLPVVGLLRRFGFLQDALPGLAEREPGDVVLQLTRDDQAYLSVRLADNAEEPV
jgi:hypothetical protein